MTICIAAISANNRLVAITDKMLTIEQPVKTIYEINENSKAIPLSKTVIALFAGDVIHANEILKRAKKILVDVDGLTTEQCATHVNDAFTSYWDEIVSNYLLRRYKVGLAQFMHNQGSFDTDLIKQVNQLIASFQVNVEIIVAGVDEDGAHVFVMDNTGTVVSRDPVGYATIGSGAQHANFSLIESGINKESSLEETTFALLQAKKRAEYDPGVGELSDLIIINEELSVCNEEKLKNIRKIFESSQVETNKIKKQTLKILKEEIC